MPFGAHHILVLLAFARTTKGHGCMLCRDPSPAEIWPQNGVMRGYSEVYDLCLGMEGQDPPNLGCRCLERNRLHYPNYVSQDERPESPWDPETVADALSYCLQNCECPRNKEYNLQVVEGIKSAAKGSKWWPNCVIAKWKGIRASSKWEENPGTRRNRNAGYGNPVRLMRAPYHKVGEQKSEYILVSFHAPKCIQTSSPSLYER